MIVNLADINDYFITLNFISIVNIRIYYFHNNHLHYLLSNPKAFISDAKCFYIIRLSDIEPYDLKISMANITDTKILRRIFSEHRINIEPNIKSCHAEFPEIMIGLMIGGNIEVYEYYISLFKSHLMLQDPKNKNTFLHNAVKAHNLELARLVIRLGIDINSTNYEGKTALHLACEIGNYDICNFLLKAGALIDIADYDNWYPLNFALINKFSDDILRSLVFKQYASMFDRHVVSPILLASLFANAEFVDYLIQNRADINTVDILGKNPLVYSLENKDKRVFNLLLSYGPNLDFVTCEGYSLLCYALLGKFDIRYVLNLVDVNMSLPNGYTALHIAAILDDLFSFKLIMDRGANIDIISGHGLSIYDCALIGNSSAIIEYLKDYCISIVDLSNIEYLCEIEKDELIFSMLNSKNFFQGQNLSKLGIFSKINISPDIFNNEIQNQKKL